MPPDRPLLRIDGVTKRYTAAGGALSALFGAAPQGLAAVDDVRFDVARGETFGLVGESGSGKSTIAKLAVGLMRPSEGAVWFDGANLAQLATRRAQMPVRRRIQMIFQDPGSSLDPRWRVGDIVSEPIRTHSLRMSAAATRRRVDEVLELVGLAARDADRHPHEFSGGQRQRISIARALASEADFIVCDEPTSALDVSIQAQVLNILVDLQRRLGLTYLFISHNLPVIGFVSHRVGVMYRGRLVECGDARAVLDAPRHPYTRALMETVLDLRSGARPRPRLAADDEDPRTLAQGCSFRARCPAASAICAQEKPGVRWVGARQLACHHPMGADAPLSA
jgi:peptide/nickel transport system ATP-binding protein